MHETTFVLVFLSVMMFVLFIVMVWIRRELLDIRGASKAPPELDISGIDRLEASSRQLNDRLNTLRLDLQREMNASRERIDAGIQRSTEAVGEVQRDLGHVREAQRQIGSLDATVKELHSVFNAPTVRGGIAELSLYTLLDDVLPGQWERQYSYSSGSRTDAIIRLGDRFVPIDAKFPLETYRAMESCEGDERATKNAGMRADIIRMIDDISAKYVRPEEGSLDMALMYLPSDKLYYSIFIHDETAGGRSSLQDHALRKRVLPVGPGMLFSYLQVISTGLRGMEVEERTKEILLRLDRLSGKFDRFRNEYTKLEDAIETTRKRYDSAGERFRIFGDEVERIVRLKGSEGEFIE